METYTQEDIAVSLFTEQKLFVDYSDYAALAAAARGLVSAVEVYNSPMSLVGKKLKLDKAIAEVEALTRFQEEANDADGR